MTQFTVDGVKHEHICTVCKKEWSCSKENCEGYETNCARFSR